MGAAGSANNASNSQAKAKIYNSTDSTVSQKVTNQEVANAKIDAKTRVRTSPNTTADKPRRSLKWRVVDLVVAAILGVACGVIFQFWNWAGAAAYNTLDALTPGVAGIVSGIWYMGGVVGALVIRKPGAALFVELLAAIVSALLGSQWGIAAVFDGLAQGIGAEIIFLLFAYRKFGIGTAMLSGLLAGAGAVLRWGFFSAGWATGSLYLTVYTITNLVSGAILGGIVAWLLVKGLAATGVLNRFAVGRELHSNAA